MPNAYPLALLVHNVVLVAAASHEDDQIAAASRWFTQNCNAKHCTSGGGSHKETTVAARKLISLTLTKYSIKTFVDCPVGSFEWMRLVNLKSVNYTGLDIGAPQMARWNQVFGKPNIHFGVLNLLKQIPPSADLVMSREFWFHIRPEMGAKALAHIRASGAKYLLTSTHPDADDNQQGIVDTGWGNEWGYYDINVEKPPFDLTAADVLESTEETLSTMGFRAVEYRKLNKTTHKRYMRLYKLR